MRLLRGQSKKRNAFGGRVSACGYTRRAGEHTTRQYSAQSLTSPGHVAFRAGVEGLLRRPHRALLFSVASCSSVLVGLVFSSPPPSPFPLSTPHFDHSHASNLKGRNGSVKTPHLDPTQPLTAIHLLYKAV